MTDLLPLLCFPLFDGYWILPIRHLPLCCSTDLDLISFTVHRSLGNFNAMTEYVLPFYSTFPHLIVNWSQHTIAKRYLHTVIKLFLYSVVYQRVRKGGDDVKLGRGGNLIGTPANVTCNPLKVVRTDM